ncbi:MAG: pilus assembly protein PilP [Myxococcales bacterium]|jgi:type IV pilus assembly protein PilP|nr:pilus assembly protein PilP [Myxococcales bacterium]MBL0194186.1 pilus assembly protein PilP [Myxococcales bacterium]HQY60495.1 pilus assembly protein PilP [Polyangiaceae bacterium]
MSRLSKGIALVGLAALSLVVGAGCKEPKRFDAVLNTGPTVADAGVAALDAAALPPSQVVKVDYSEGDFVEADQNRDPFRSFAATLDETRKGPKPANQRKVLLGQYSLDELKLAAIVTGGDYPRAMLIDPGGKGWVLKRGDFLGRPDTVHVGGANGADYQLNWRVDRVRATDVVLVREDPAQPNLPPSTRVLALHPEGEPKLQLD